LSKYIKPILTGLVVGFVVAFLLTFLYGPRSNAPWYYGAGAGLLGAYLAANLAGNRARPGASGQQKTEALEGGPRPGMARLFLYREGFVAKLAGLNVAVDGQVVGQLKSPQFTCVSLSPGRHVLTAAFGGLAGPQNRAAQLIVEAPPGGEVAVLMTVKMGVARNAVDMKWQSDVESVKLTLAGMAMCQPEVAEI
jgi:hypothetical protein